MVLCVRALPDDEYRQDHTAYVWTGPNFEVDSTMNEQVFVQKCIKAYWGEQEANKNIAKIVRVNSEQPSD